LKLLLQ